MCETEFEKATEVDNLVVAPVSDVRPRVFGFDNLPVDSLGGYLVWVVAIDGGGVEELGDNAIDIVGVRDRQGFPVLEYVAPVALVGDEPLAVLVVDADVKEIPRATGVSVSAGECEWQVLHKETVQLMVLLRKHQFFETAVGNLLGQSAKEAAVLLCEGAVERGDMLGKSGTVYRIVVTIKASAHGVEERVGEMACHACLIGCVLDAVVLPDDSAKGGCGLGDGGLHLCGSVRLLHKTQTATYLRGILHHIADVVPRMGFACGEGLFQMRKYSTAHAFGLRFG